MTHVVMKLCLGIAGYGRFFHVETGDELRFGTFWIDKTSPFHTTCTKFRSKRVAHKSNFTFKPTWRACSKIGTSTAALHSSQFCVIVNPRTIPLVAIRATHHSALIASYVLFE